MGNSLESDFARFADHSDAVIAIDPGGRIAYVNPAAINLYGLSRGDVAGMPIGELLAGERAPLPWDERLACDRWSGVEVHRTPEGLRVWADASLAQHGPGHHILRAMRAGGRRVVESKSVDLLEELRDALALGNVGTWFDDGVTERIDWSAGARRVFGAAPDAAVDHEYFFRRIHPDDRAEVGAAIQDVMVDQSEIIAGFRVVDDDGTVRHVRTFGTALFDPDGTSILGLGGCVDVTDGVRKDERIRSLEQQLRQSQKMEAVGRLAGGIAHDFNNILTAILGNTELLLRDELTELGRSCTEDVRIAVRRAADLTQQLLAFSRKQPMAMRVVVLDEVVEESQRMLARMIGERVSMVFTAGSEGALVYADSSQLQQVLTNLVVNAAQSMVDGGTVTMGSRRITLSELDGEADPDLVPRDFVELTVSDSGRGIATEDLPHIFEPFYTTKTATEGTGLGLSTVHGIVEQHGGGIEVSSAPGEGTTFRVRFPRSLATGADRVAETAGPGTSLVGLRVLLVEDEQMIRTITTRLLEEAGVVVTSAADGREALEVADQPFDLLLSDVIMPNMTGPELAETLRRDRPDLRVLYVSGYPADIVDKRVVLGPNERLLRKPYARRDLLQAVRICSPL